MSAPLTPFLLLALISSCTQRKIIKLRWLQSGLAIKCNSKKGTFVYKKVKIDVAQLRSSRKRQGQSESKTIFVESKLVRGRSRLGGRVASRRRGGSVEEEEEEVCRRKCGDSEGSVEWG